MKTKLVLSFVVLVSPLLSAFAQSALPPAQISVSWSAEAKVAPDEIHLSVGVETRHETLEEAKRQNDESIEQSAS